MSESKMFSKVDKNGDGVVSLEELIEFLDTIGIKASQEELLLLLGKSSLDFIDFFFFYDAITNTSNVFTENELKKVFRVFDINGDGYISCDELGSALSRLGLWDEQSGKDCNNMINVYDTNSDGKLDFQEFMDMMFAN